MSPERVLSMPLSGLEVRRAILDKLADRLSRDCFLTENMSYDSFYAKVRVEVKAKDVGQEREVDVTEVVRDGPQEPLDALEASEAEFEINPAPPNEVRVETGQEVPILSKDTEGRNVIKGAKYARSKAKTVA